MKELTQADVVHRLSPAQKLRAAEQLYWSARALKAAALRAQHPDWSPNRIERAVREVLRVRRSCAAPSGSWRAGDLPASPIGLPRQVVCER